jgi:hypothetical protein
MPDWQVVRKPTIWAGILFQAVMLLVTIEATAADLLLSPSRIDIGTFFDGAQVSLEAKIPSGAEAVVEIVGATGRVALMRKGRRAGLWMSVGEIQIDQTPNLYLVMSSSPQIPTLTDQASPWGFAALESQIQFSGALDSHEKERFFQEFIELKESAGLYGTLPGSLKIKNSHEGSKVTGSFNLPAKVAPGSYQVRLSVVRDGRLLEQITEEIQVKMVGFPAMLASLAFEHGALHGLVGVGIAIATGFIMGFLFKDKASH